MYALRFLTIAAVMSLVFVAPARATPLDLEDDIVHHSVREIAWLSDAVFGRLQRSHHVIHYTTTWGHPRLLGQLDDWRLPDFLEDAGRLWGSSSITGIPARIPLRPISPPWVAPDQRRPDASVPEPSTLLVIGAGAFGAIAAGRRRRR